MLFLCRYFSLQATQPLGMGDGVRIEIETRICNERGPRQDSYLPAQLIAYDTMNEARERSTQSTLVYRFSEKGREGGEYKSFSVLLFVCGA